MKLYYLNGKTYNAKSKDEVLRRLKMNVTSENLKKIIKLPAMKKSKL